MKGKRFRLHCYGLSSVYHQDSETCQQCPDNTACEEASYAKLLSLSSRIDVRDALARYQNRDALGMRKPEMRVAVEITLPPPERTVKNESVALPLTDADRALISRLPVKVAAKVQSMMMKNEDRAARLALLHGKNPFPRKGAGPLHVACEMLLHGGFDRVGLRKRLIEVLGCGESGAYSHVSFVVAMFPALRFAKEEQGTFTLHPNLRKKE